MRLLVIEDEIELRTNLANRLIAEGYQVDQSGDGDDGLFQLQEYPFDAAIIDIGLPGLSGIEIIKSIRNDGNTLPILILTARSRWQEKVEGLDAGADDYLVKPFQMEELLARVKALLRRANESANSLIECGPLSIETSKKQATINHTLLTLTDFEYRLLEYLVLNKNKVSSKSLLADYLYPHEDDRDSNVIEVMIGRLRKKLDSDGSLKPIETLRQRGYRITLCD